MKDNGFTLVELLAVLVILGITALISVPIVGSVLEQMKVNNYRNSVYGLLRAVETDHTESGASTNEYIIVDGVVEPDIGFTGKIEGSGSITYDENEKTTIKIGTDKLCATKAPNKKQITVTRDKCQ